MGKIFQSNTWRAPLQLIDCWLPSPTLRKIPAANEPLSSPVVQRFARAGWLKRGLPRDAAPRLNAVPAADAEPGSRVRVLRQAESRATPSAKVRLVISGRINDVCAELDRLADQERQLAMRAA